MSAATAPAWEADLRLAAGDVLTSNQRLHYYARSSRVRSIREVAAATARLTRAPHLTRARITITIAFPDRRRRDTHNLMPTAKAVVDPSPRAWGRRTFTFRIAVTDLGGETPA